MDQQGKLVFHAGPYKEAPGGYRYCSRYGDTGAVNKKMTYSISKVLTLIFLPPGIFLLLLIVLLVLSYRTKRTTTRTLLAVMILVVYILSVEPVSRLLLTPLERVYPFRTADSFSTEPADAVVVLGAGTVITGSGDAVVPLPSSETLSRLMHGFLIHSTTGLPIVVSGGIPRGGLFSEAETMRTCLLTLGVPDGKIILEADSRTTSENAQRTAEIDGVSEVVLVTSACHMPRSAWLFEKNGFSVIPAPSDFKISGKKYDFWSFFPTMQALNDSYRALHEYGGILVNLLHFVKNKKKG